MLQQRSIRNELAVALWGVAIIVFAVAGAAFALFEDLTLERRALQIMEPYAQLVSVGAEAAVAFMDPRARRKSSLPLGRTPIFPRPRSFCGTDGCWPATAACPARHSFPLRSNQMVFT